MTIRNHKPIVSPPNDDSHKMILLKYNSIKELPSHITEVIESKSLKVVEKYEVKVGYNEISFAEAFRMLLPKEIPPIHSFEQVGHIAHINLDKKHSKYKFIIGRIIMDKNPTVSTVINKTGTIENKFRVLPLELLAGDPKYVVDIREYGIRFQFDYSEVYWNSRLAYEHQRLVTKFVNKGDIVCDMFAGIGPFVIPMAKKKRCICYANDLNPASYKYLVHNCKLNSVQNLVKCFNLDGKKFMEEVVKNGIQTNHVIMNLPKTAMDFLYIFKNLYPKNFTVIPIIHCYTFLLVKKEDIVKPKDVLKMKVNSIFDSEEIEYEDIHEVREVSAYKKMFCVSFKLPFSVLWRKKRRLEVSEKKEEEEEKSDIDIQLRKKTKN